ncbi:MAG: CHAT domain-containing protein [Elusimicrobia bacterium]|nr:CHAT domain-containing protein [Elusimicrobiota bacterium]
MPVVETSENPPAPGSDWARKAYAEAWRTYFGFRKTGARDAVEKGYALLQKAIPVFEVQNNDYYVARSLYVMSILAGILSRPDEAHRAAVRAAAILASLMKARRTDEEGPLWMIRAQRSLASGHRDPKARLLACKIGFRLVRRTPVSVTKNPNRFRALFHREAGAAEAHREPKTARGLLRSERHLRQAIRCFHHSADPAGIATSEAKAWRELARTLRAQANRLRQAGREAQALKRLAEAEQALRLAVELYAKKESVSQWNHFHLAKVLRDKGDLPGALKECLTAVEYLEQDREGFDEDDNRIACLSDHLAIFDLGVMLAHALDQPLVAFELSQRCKARVFLERFHAQAPSHAKTEPAHLLDAQRLCRYLAAGEAILDYHVGRYAVSLFLVTAHGVKAQRIMITRLELERKVERFYDALRQEPTAQSSKLCQMILKSLGGLLLEPFWAELKNLRSLCIVPSGKLADLPFAALLLPDGSAAVERWNLSYLPSAGMLPIYRKERRAVARKPTVLALADPTGGLDHARQEAKELSAMFPGSRVFIGKDATRAALASIRNENLLHIACHGEFRPEDTLASFLCLAAEKGDDGRLHPEEIVGLDLSGVDLAFLSCCKTAWGRHKGSDEIEGVHRAFLEAGGRSVIVTLWDISDTVTRGLVTSFYKRLAEGRPKSEALREAKLEVLRRGGLHAHPYFWAAFKLVGSS